MKYIFLSMIFLGLTDSVFVGFFTRAFQYYLLCAGVAILTVLCVLLERYPKAVFGAVGFAAAAAFFFKERSCQWISGDQQPDGRCSKSSI